MRGFVVRLAAACAVLLLVGAGVAYATGSLPFVGSDGTITACVQRVTGELRLQGTTVRHCNARTEQTVTWSQQGPQGDPGVDGRSIVATTADCDGNGGFSLAYDDGTPIGTLCNGATGATGSLVGSACALPDTTPGTVAETVAVDGTITFACQTSPGSGGGDGGDGGTGGGIGPGGTPQAEVCNGIDDDLDGITDDHLTDTPTVANGTAVCDPGVGYVLQCSAPYADADGQIGDGCESNLQSDPHNCGTVGHDVTLLPGVQVVACVNGQPVIQECAPGYEDLDGNPVDGCEYGPIGTTATAPKTAPSRHESQRPV